MTDSTVRNTDTLSTTARFKQIIENFKSNFLKPF